MTQPAGQWLSPLSWRPRQWALRRRGKAGSQGALVAQVEQFARRATSRNAVCVRRTVIAGDPIGRVTVLAFHASDSVVNAAEDG